MDTEPTKKLNTMAVPRIALILSIIGVILLAIHFIALKAQKAHGDESWLIRLELALTTSKPGIIFNIQPPHETGNVRLVGRTLNHQGLHIVPPLKGVINKRGIRLRPGKAGTYDVVIEFSLQHSQTPRFHSATLRPLTTQRREFFLADNSQLQLDDLALESTLADLSQKEINTKEQVEHIFQFVQGLAIGEPSSLQPAPDILASRTANHQERAILMTALCRKAGIPARIVTGLELKDDPSATPSYWTEAYIKDDWIAYHPGLGYKETLPTRLIALDKFGSGAISVTTNGIPVNMENQSFDVNIQIERNPETVYGPDNTRREWYQVFMLDRLPGDTRQELALLMLLPLGALLTALIKQIGGFHSYGVFTPTILALAMVYADWELTLLMLSIVLGLVYFGRPTFRPGMSRTPRLAIVFTLVSVSMVLGVSLLDYFSLATDGQLILLPIVILTFLIDRFYSTVESLGYHTAFVRLAWTLIITFVTLPLLQLQWLGSWILRYPEFHLLTIAGLITLAETSFKQYRLPAWLSLLSEPEAKKKKRKSKTTPRKQAPASDPPPQ